MFLTIDDAIALLLIKKKEMYSQARITRKNQFSFWGYNSYWCKATLLQLAKTISERNSHNLTSNSIIIAWPYYVITTPLHIAMLRVNQKIHCSHFSLNCLGGSSFYCSFSIRISSSISKVGFTKIDKFV